MRHRRGSTESGVSRVQLGSWIGLACVLGLVLPLSASSKIFGQRPLVPDGYTPGIQTVGAMGVAESVDSIMARQGAADLLPPRPYRMMPEHEVERGELPQNPEAPDLPTWPPGSDPHTPSISGGPDTPQTPGTSFTGATLTDTGAFPPDSMGAVGPTQYVVFVNGQIRTFNKATGVADGVINADPDVFFASAMTPVSPPVVLNFTSDPQVRYDRLSGRWFMSIIDVPCTNATCTTLAPNRWLLAVSNAGSNGVISGSTVWTFFFFQTDASNFDDYPSLGIDANALYTGGNMFSSAGAFVGTNGYVVRKSSVLGAGPIVVTTFANLALGAGAGPFAPRGVDNYDPAATEGYFIGVDNATFGTLILRRVSNPAGSPSISANISLAVSTTSSNIPVGHLGNTGGNNGRLDSLDDRLYAAHIRNGRLWTSHNIGVTAAGTAGGTTGATGTKRMAVRWYELNGVRSTDNGGVPIVVQSGTVFDSAATVATAIQYWIPSVMVSGQGHAALAFSTAGVTTSANTATVGRLSSDTLGAVETIQNTTATASAYNPPSDPGGAAGRRWGDYSYTSLDPLGDMTMWTIQDFCDSNNSYGVRVVQLLAPPPATPASAPSTAAGQSSVNVVVTGTSVSGSGFYDPGANLTSPALPFHHISASVTGGVVVNSVTFTDPTHVTLNLNTNGASTGAKNVQVCNPDGQCATGTSIFTVAPGVPTPTPTATVTPTATGTLTPTPTATATRTITPTFTPTIEGTPTNTPTPTPTANVTGTPLPLVPTALAVDAASGTGTISNANGVLEPGERVVVKPSWKNASGSFVSTFGGGGANPTGPVGATYLLPTPIATYPGVGAGFTVDCGSNCYQFSVSNPASRPAAHWDASFDESIGSVPTKTWLLHVGSSFADTPSSNPQYRFIETLLHKGVTAGCSPGNFCPTLNVSRQQMAVFLLIANDGSSYTPPACTVPLFTDVPCSSGFAPWINELSNRGVTAGCGPGLYCPTADVTRAQMAVFLLKTRNGTSYTPPACVTSMFTDVPCSSGFAPWVNELAVEGITAGCGGGLYCPASPNTRGQMAVFLTTTFGLKLYGP